MSLKLTAKELTDSLPAFALLANEKVKKNPKLAYNLGKTSKALRVEGEALKAQELDIFKEFGAKEEKNGQFHLDRPAMSEERRAEFDQRMKDLQAIEVEVWGTKLTLAEIEKFEIELSPIQYDLLSWMIADPDEETATPEATAAAGA